MEKQFTQKQKVRELKFAEELKQVNLFLERADKRSETLQKKNKQLEEDKKGCVDSIKKLMIKKEDQNASNQKEQSKITQ